MTRRCDAITQDGERCRRPLSEENRRDFCPDHRGLALSRTKDTALLPPLLPTALEPCTQDIILLTKGAFIHDFTPYVRNDEYLVRMHAASHRSLPAQLLTELSNDEAWQVRQRVAANPNASQAALTALSCDNDHLVRKAVASNRSTDPADLHSLAKSDDMELLFLLAANPSAPDRCLAALSSHPHYEVRLRVTENSSTPREVLTSLRDDSNSMVAASAERRSKRGILRRR